MTIASLHPLRALKAILRLTWVELKLFLREPTTAVFVFAFPLVLLFVMGEIFGQGANADLEFRGASAMDYYVPAYVGLVAASIGVIMLPSHLTAYRKGGILKRYRAALVPMWIVLGAQVGAALVLAALGAALVWLAGLIVYDVSAPDSLPGVLLAFALTTICFAALGVLLGALLPAPRAAQGAGLMLFFVMLFVSGTGPPVEVMSETMVTIGEWLPLQHAVVALQDPWLALGWNAWQLLVLASVALAAAGVALRVYRWE
jgi:ABC-2 type transport system permease protein